MGRAFEFRKGRKMKRWAFMAKTFTRIGKDIVMAVKESGPDPETNSKLRAVIQNAKAVNMPKDNIDRAIKKATDKDTSDYKEMVYEGYGPHGIAIVIETATDNTNRTVANIRSYFNKLGGSLGTTGSLEFIFSRVCTFNIPKGDIDIDIEELELELIDHGLEEIFIVDDEVVIYGAFESYGTLQAALEEKGYEIGTSGFERIPNDLKTLNEEQVQEVEKLIEKIEEDEDVQNVYHNMQE